MTFIIFTNVAIFIVLLAFLYILNKKHVKFSNRVFAGLGLGILFGLVLQVIFGATSDIIAGSVAWFNIVGTGYVKLLQMVAMPLVFISILSAFSKLKLGSNLGKIAGLILLLLIGTTAIASTVGIISATLFDLDASQLVHGEEERERGATLEEKVTEVSTLPEQIVELIPANPFLDLTGARSTSTIAVVIFAAFLGFSYLRIVRKERETSKTIKKAIDGIYSLIMGVVTIVLRLTPYGIMAIMARTVATSDFGAIYNLGKFVIASYIALITVFIIHLIIILLSGLSPIIYIKKAMETLLFAFTSRSSAGTLPLNLKTQVERFGVPEGIANFASSFGLSIGQNGCAGVYPAMLAIMIAPTVGIDPLDIRFIITVIVVVAISSFGVAGVGGGATFAAIIVLSALDLPVALAGVLISVEPLIDMGRTALNVSGSMVAGITTSRITGEINKDVYNNPKMKELGES
ncbi:L-cystine transporter [Lysinibacillus halotolerans]|uniref:L-cystine transporter n=1 Tax=Lysinibacillus halotolerans TaxID=1368476 RepID=UPI001F4DC95B|nr:cation:dicarboxylase symporter family transporter [Lysinibacillus halotolerans]